MTLDTETRPDTHDGLSTPPEVPQPTASPGPHIRLPSLRSRSDPPRNVSATSTPLGPVSAARKGPAAAGGGFAASNADFQAKLQAFQASRLGAPPGGPVNGGVSPVTGRQFNFGGRPLGPQPWSSAPIVAGHPRAPAKPSLAQRRMNFPGSLSAATPPVGNPVNGGETNTNTTTSSGMRGKRPHPGKLSSSGGASDTSSSSQGSLFDKYSQFVDKETGSLKFAGKAVIHGKGVNFSSGSSFNMSLDEIQTLEELGKGNYGTVYKVIHHKPISYGRRGSISSPQMRSPESTSSGSPTPEEQQERSPLSRGPSTGNGRVMAMKEIRLELDENKFAQIIMELDVLHRCRSPYIIDFYGAFFQEGAVYICMEHMDGGSIDKLYRGGVPEGVLRKIAYSAIMGLKTLKDDHNIIHRDVKPTNILVNTRGRIKLCDFGVSGNLVASIAKTNIGCQSYMAPERIASGGTQASFADGTGPSGAYSVQSDVWSLGLSILECAMGCYPYPPETYNNIFSQLSAIVEGEPPELPEDGFSAPARDFVKGCLHKVPKSRPSYAMLLQHPWIAEFSKPKTITEEAEEAAERGDDFEVSDASPELDEEVSEWVIGAMKRRKEYIEQGIAGPEKPALHAAPLDAVSSPTSVRQPPSLQANVEEVSAGVEQLSTA